MIDPVEIKKLEVIKEKVLNEGGSVVVWKDGTYLFCEDSWEYEGDPDYLVTIEIPSKNLGGVK